MNPKFKLQNLPQKIEVHIIKGKSGRFIAELPKYDVFTEADGLAELHFNVNDLIYALFDIPKKYQGKFWYNPAAMLKSDKPKLPDQYKILVTPEYYHYFVQ